MTFWDWLPLLNLMTMRFIQVVWKPVCHSYHWGLLWCKKAPGLIYFLTYWGTFGLSPAFGYPKHSYPEHPWASLYVKVFSFLQEKYPEWDCFVIRKDKVNFIFLNAKSFSRVVILFLQCPTPQQCTSILIIPHPHEQLVFLVQCWLFEQVW